MRRPLPSSQSRRAARLVAVVVCAFSCAWAVACASPGAVPSASSGQAAPADAQQSLADSSAAMDSGAGADSSAAPDGGSDVVADAGAVPVCAVLPTLKSLEDQYFSGSCAFSKCHGALKPAGALDLTPGHAWAQLVGVPAALPAAAAAGLVRVVPGKPDASFLYHKVHGPPGFGVLMPQGTDTVVDAECSVAALRKWIQEGALNN